jgi:hypothetical protein
MTPGNIKADHDYPYCVDTICCPSWIGVLPSQLFRRATPLQVFSTCSIPICKHNKLINSSLVNNRGYCCPELLPTGRRNSLPPGDAVAGVFQLQHPSIGL